MYIEAGDEDGLISEGIFILVPSSKKTTPNQITIPQLFNLTQKVDGHWFGSFFEVGTKSKIPSELTIPLKSKEHALIEKLEADEDYDSNEAKIEALENLDHERISMDLKNFDETGTAFPKRALIISTVTQIFNTIILFIHVTNVAK